MKVGLILFSQKDKKHKAYFLYNIADLYFRIGNIEKSVNLMLRNIKLAHRFNPDLVDGLVDYSYFSFRFAISISISRKDILFKKDDKYPYGYFFHKYGLQELQKYLHKKNISRSIEAQILLYAIQIGYVLRNGINSPNILNNQQNNSTHPLSICIDNLKVLNDKLKDSERSEYLVEVLHLLWLAMFLKVIFGIKSEVEKQNYKKQNHEKILEDYFYDTIKSCERLKCTASQLWMKSIIYNNQSVLSWCYKVKNPAFNKYEESIRKSFEFIKINPYVNENARQMGVNLKSEIVNHTIVQKDLFNEFRTQSYMPILRIEDYRQNRVVKMTDKEQYSLSEVYI